MLVFLLIACTDGADTDAPKDTSGGESGDSDTNAATDSDTGQGDSETGGEDSDTGGDDTDTNIVDTCSTGSDPPVEPPPSVACEASLPWIDVAAGIAMSCGVKSDGCGECWGRYTSETRYAVPGVAFQSIVTSNSTPGLAPHICGIDVDGAVVCWGGTSGYEEDLTPTGAYTSIGVVELGGAAVRSDGRLVGWGLRDSCGDDVWSEVVASGEDYAAVTHDGILSVGIVPDYWIAATGSWSNVAHGGFNVCGIRTDLGGAVACVNTEDAGEETATLGVPSDGEYIDVCVSGGSEVCALDTAGTPSCWHAGESYLASPPTGPFVKLACGSQHACGLTPDGSIECWGNDFDGETIPPS